MSDDRLDVVYAISVEYVIDRSFDFDVWLKRLFLFIIKFKLLYFLKRNVIFVLKFVYS